LIKTATALGGGLAIVRGGTNSKKPNGSVGKGSTLGQKMNHLQWGTLYKRQSKWAFFKAVLKALFLRLLTQSPHVYGLICFVLESWLGCNIDVISKFLVQTFDTKKKSTDTENQGDKFMQQIRQKPCSQLMSLLCYRLEDSSTTRAHVARRVATCRRITKQLDPSQVVLHHNHLQRRPQSTSWLFPIRYPTNTESDARILSERIRKHGGVDLAQSASQLLCVDGAKNCPRATRLMQNIVYLPVTGRGDSRCLSSQDVHTLYKALSKIPKGISTTNSPIKSTGPNRIGWYIAIVWSVYQFRRVAVPLVQTMVFLLATFFAFAIVLRWSISDFYLNHSHAFAKYCWLLDNDESNHSSESGQDKDAPQVIESIPLLNLPKNKLERKDKGRTVLLTGATGFIGSMLLRDLLKHRRELCISKVLLLCRSKRGRSPGERIRHLLADKIFEFLSSQQLSDLVEVVEGDVTEHGLGLSASCKVRLLRDESLTHVIHCAAAVNFTQSLENAAKCNVSGPLNVQQLASDMLNDDVVFVHLSTAFVHGSRTGTVSSPLGEELFELEGFDPKEVYQSMLGSQYVATKCLADHGFHNTYTFSKCICEHLLFQNASTVKTLILRPSIVGPAVQYPFEGWCGPKPTTFVAAACLYLNFQWNLWCFGPQNVPYVPVDVLSRLVIRRALDGPAGDGLHAKSGVKQCSAKESEHFDPCSIHNATWDASSPDSAQFTWLEFAVMVTQIGTLMGYFSRMTAYAGLFVTKRVLPTLQLGTSGFAKLHSIAVSRPFSFALQVANFFGIRVSGLEKVLAYLDLPLLFFPFSTNSFFFTSGLVAPSSFDAKRYAFIGSVAAHKFSSKMAPGRFGLDLDRTDMIQKRGINFLSDALLAFTQPCGNIMERFASIFLSFIFRRTCSEITVDMKSFAKSLRDVDPSSRRRILLAPTHRSFYDFLIISLFCFTFPELKIDLPVIAAASEFSRIPLLKLILPFCRVFYIFRGKGRSSTGSATTKLDEVLRKDSVAVEIFVEGTRSRDRRFMPPKTGLLRCIYEKDATFVVVPIVINYERIPDQEALAEEAGGGKQNGMKMRSLLSWLMVS